MSGADARGYRLALAGRSGSGKDTLAALAMHAVSGTRYERVAFGDAVISECELVIGAIRSDHGTDPAVAVARALGMPVESVRPFTALLAEPVRAGTLTFARERGPVARRAMQLLGDARRAADPGYWIRTALGRAADLATGASVYVPDVRTVEEADAVRNAGFLLVHVQCAEPVRQRRLAARDGAPPDAATARHRTETGLADYDRFHLMVRNDEDSLPPSAELPAVQAIVAALAAHEWRTPGRAHR